MGARYRGRSPGSPMIELLVLAGQIGALIVLLLAFLILAYWWGQRSSRRMGAPRLEVARGPYSLGDTVHCRLVTTVRSPLRVERFVFALACREWVRWEEDDIDAMGEPTRRTDSKQAEVWWCDRAVPGPRELRAGEVLDLEVEFELPIEGPPTFAAPNNCINWVVFFHAAVSNGPDVEVWEVLTVQAARRVSAPASKRA